MANPLNRICGRGVPNNWWIPSNKMNCFTLSACPLQEVWSISASKCIQFICRAIAVELKERSLLWRNCWGRSVCSYLRALEHKLKGLPNHFLSPQIYMDQIFPITPNHARCDRGVGPLKFIMSNVKPKRMLSPTNVIFSLSIFYISSFFQFYYLVSTNYSS